MRSVSFLVEHTVPFGSTPLKSSSVAPANLVIIWSTGDFVSANIYIYIYIYIYMYIYFQCNC